MQFADYARDLAKLGRDINPATMVATRNLVQALIDDVSASDVQITRDVCYGSAERQRLDVFTPSGAPEPERPVLVFVHGGGFVGGDKHTPGTPFYANIAIWAVRNGCNAVNLTYRLAPQHQWPSGIEDIHAALECIGTRGAEFGISGERIFLMGQSVGATHAAGYVAHPEIAAPHAHALKGLILLSGLYNLAGLSGPMEQAYLGADTALYAERSPLAGLVASGLPLLVTIAEHDPPGFEQQALELLSARQQQHQQLPRVVHMLGQNHFSVPFYLGLPGDLLAPQLTSFIREYS